MNSKFEFFKSQALLGRMDRREFLGRSAALGITAASATSLLSSAALAAGPKRGGTIRLGVQGGSTTDSLDPALSTNSTSNQVSRLWCEMLVDLAPGGGIQGGVAESWNSSPDAVQWRFKIRNGIMFSNGQKVTAEDAAQTLRRHSNEDSKSGALGIMRGVKSIKAEGDEVVVELNGGNADLPYLIADYHLVIQPNGGFDDPVGAIGTGPYILKEVDMGVRFVAERNPHYWNSEDAHADVVEVLVINDNTARMAALQSGQVDIVERVPPRTAGLVARSPKITVQSTSSAGHYVFIAHVDTDPFSNQDVMMALKYGMNRQEMVDKVLFGYGSVGNDTPINSAYPLFTEFEQREYDPDKAAFHWKKSGYDQPVLLRTSENSFPGAPDAAALFQQSLQQAGIPLEIKREPNDGYWSEVWNKQPFCTSYWGGRPVQDQMWSTAYISSADWNDTRFKNEQFDQLLVAARGELDQVKRKQMYADMGNMVRNEGGLICPMFNDFIDAYNDTVTGWIENYPGFGLMNFQAFKKMWVLA